THKVHSCCIKPVIYHHLTGIQSVHNTLLCSRCKSWIRKYPTFKLRESHIHSCFNIAKHHTQSCKECLYLCNEVIPPTSARNLHRWYCHWNTLSSIPCRHSIIYGIAFIHIHTRHIPRTLPHHKCQTYQGLL